MCKGRGPSPYTQSPEVLKAISPESLTPILTSNTEYTGEEDGYISAIRNLSEKMIDSRIVFLNERWQNSGNETLQALGHLFDSDRKKAIGFMEKEGVKMTRMIEAATDDYYDWHFRTLNRKDRKAALEAQKQNREYRQILAGKESELTDTRNRLSETEKALAAALARLAEYEK